MNQLDLQDRHAVIAGGAVTAAVQQTLAHAQRIDVLVWAASEPPKKLPRWSAGGRPRTVRFPLARCSTGPADVPPIDSL